MDRMRRTTTSSPTRDAAAFLEPLERIVEESAERAAAIAADRAAEKLLRKIEKQLAELVGEAKRSPLYTIKEYAEMSAYTEAALYKLRRRADRNGLAEAKVFVKRGNRLFIHDRRFRRWQEGH